MDELSNQIASGLHGDWKALQVTFDLPEHTTVVFCARQGPRKLIFLRVKGHLRSAMPLFNTNAELRKSNFETVWFFDDQAIPSTKHMPCASIRMIGDTVIATISNVTQGTSPPAQVIEVAALANAVAQQRMRLSDFTAGCRVNVTFTSDEMVCINCGSIRFEVEKATFQPADHPGAPGLSLSKSKIGRNVSTLIVDALKWCYPAIDCACTECLCEMPSTPSTGPKVTRTIGGIELSSLAAFELVRHNQTAWYVA